MTFTLLGCPFCGGEAESDSQRGYRNIWTGNPENAAAVYCTKCSADMTWCYRDTPEIERDQVMTLLVEQWNTRATASLQGEDAVERVARIVDPEAFEDDRLTWENRRVRALNRARAILATGLVPDEAAVRADEREKIKDLSCESLLVMSDGYLNNPADDNVRVALSNAAVLIFGKERALRIRAAIRSGGAK